MHIKLGSEGEITRVCVAPSRRVSRIYGRRIILFLYSLLLGHVFGLIVVHSIMAWRSSGGSYVELLRNLRSNQIIKSKEVFDAMSKVDRGHYVSHNPYMDSPQPIGFEATISAPHMHAYALEYLKDKLESGNRALDVGSGTGYLTVAMAHMVEATEGKGMVVGVDYIQGLVDMSIENVKRDIPHLLNSPNFKLMLRDGWKGVPEHAPYDAIHVGAAASEVPQALVDQLAPGGIMVVPVGQSHAFCGQELTLVTKDEKGNVNEKPLLGVSYVPLVKTYS
eukprot:GHVQ01019835.1.p1 GENE.GHVQ01019835.1~~GHVQ01019835.1.p1  ORF type:complete len:278 (-),score=32.37 GHVQ01019835.1:514-1347(-)